MFERSFPRWRLPEFKIPDARLLVNAAKDGVVRLWVGKILLQGVGHIGEPIRWNLHAGIQGTSAVPEDFIALLPLSHASWGPTGNAHGIRAGFNEGVLVLDSVGPGGPLPVGQSIRIPFSTPDGARVVLFSFFP